MRDTLLGRLLTAVASPIGAAYLIAVILVIVLVYILIKYYQVRPGDILIKLKNTVMSFSSKSIGRQEIRYHRDITIGKINEKKNRVKVYRFLNDLIIDLGLKRRGATPYEFLWLTIVSTFLISLVICQILFSNMFMMIVLFPILFLGTVCMLYTKANIAHDRRIEAVIEAENIVCNNIKNGVVVSVRQSIDVIPLTVRGEFQDFLDNITHKNFHIRTALLELNNSLGSVSDDFIKKCIEFEMEEEHGVVGIFSDVVAINNIKSEFRIEMKRKFEDVRYQFTLGAIMIFVFLGGVIAIYENVANFYFHNPIGQLILVLDLLLLVLQFVWITYLRAKEL